MSDLLIDLRTWSALGSSRALSAALRDAIRSGRLPTGSRLPSSRALAVDVGLARSTVVEAYEQLTAEGFLVARRGSGTEVSTISVQPCPVTSPPDPPDRFPVNFLPGEPDCSSFPRALWLASARRVLSTAGDDLFGYGDQRGLRDLRRTLSAYLGRVRGVAAQPERIEIVSGVSTGLGLVAQAFRASGITRIAVEDPGMPFHRGILGQVGLDPTPVPVDGHGIDVERLAATDVRAVLVTPAHQYPLGGALAPDRRAALVAWARERDAWIIEDDYDGEFRYDRQPVGALQGLEPDRVLYAGTASKSLAPGIRVAWLVVPPALARSVGTARAWRGGASQVEQAVLADMIETGAYDRHVRRMRAMYRSRRDLLVDRLRAEVPWLEIPGIAAGQHFTATLPDPLDEATVVGAAARRGIGLFPLALHRVLPGEGGLVVGFSRPPGHAFPAAVETLCGFLADVAPGQAVGSSLPGGTACA